MTFILALGNSQQVIQLSDRRLTSLDQRAEVIDENSNKALTLWCADARVAVGYTGLARTAGGMFDTQTWLNVALSDCGKPDFSIKPMLERFSQRATDDFALLPKLKQLSPSSKRLSVMFTGYFMGEDPPRLINGLVTNFQDVENSVDSDEAWERFRWCIFRARADVPHPTLVQWVGAWNAIRVEEEAALRALLEGGKPAKAILGKAVEILRAVADRPEARGTVGRNLSSIVIPRDETLDSSVGYHVESASVTFSLPDVVIARGEQATASFMGGFLKVQDPATGKAVPAALPKIGKDSPCPCGSGKRYRKCCRRKRRN